LDRCKNTANFKRARPIIDFYRTPMTTRFAAILLSSVLLGCATTHVIPTVDAVRVSKISVGQSRLDVEKIMGHTSDLFTLALKPNELVQAWRYQENYADKCLFVTYDPSERVIAVTPVEKERGRSPMPLPRGC
jgi:hypothetical protein